MAAMMNTQALREAHVFNTARRADGTRSRRACPCCVTLQPRTEDAKKLRRAQRRREAQAFRAGREDA